MPDVDLKTIMAEGDFLQRVGDELVGTSLAVAGMSPTDGDANSATIQAEIDRCNALPAGGVVLLPPGKFPIAVPLILKPNVVLRGSGKYHTILYVAVDDARIITGHALPYTDGDGSFIGVEDLTLWGYHDRNTTLGGDPTRLTYIGQADFVWFSNVYAKHSRQMSLSNARSRTAVVRGCTIRRSARDAINLTGARRVIVTDNEIEECGDDAIAVHVASTATTVDTGQRQIVCSNNRIQKSYGVKLLGAHNTSVTGNTFRFVYGYAINVSKDSTFGEGFTTGHSVVISGNSITDVIDANVVGASTLGKAIWVSHPKLNDNALGYYPHHIAQGNGTQAIGYLDPALNSFNVPASNFYGGSHGVVITNNVITQTLQELTTFSDSGFGSLFNNTGTIDPAYPGSIWNRIRATGAGINAIVVGDGSTTDFLIANNSIYGTRRGILLEASSATKATFVPSGQIVGNRFIRMESGVTANTWPAGTRSDLYITDNHFDLDPLFESPDRQLVSGEPTGAWTTTTGLTAYVVFMTNANGFYLTRNQIKNCSTLHYNSSGSGYVAENVVWLDTRVTTPSTLGVALGSANWGRHKLMHYNGDPRSATYGELDLGQSFTHSTQTMPTTGYYVKEAVVWNAATAIATGTMIIGWKRLTTGSAHVLNTDWAQMKVTTT